MCCPEALAPGCGFPVPLISPAKAGGSQLAQLHRFADQVGMSATGLALHGFKVADRELAGSAHTPERMTALEPAKHMHERLVRPVDGAS